MARASGPVPARRRGRSATTPWRSAACWSRQVGGPSARPYQPAGYWSHLNFPKREYQADHGDGLYRRGLYTYWCRTFLHPSLLAFDAPTREECTVAAAPVEHPAPGPRPAERPDLRRGRPRPGRADPARGGRARAAPGSTGSTAPCSRGAPAGRGGGPGRASRQAPRRVPRPTAPPPPPCSGPASAPCRPTSTRPNWRPGRRWRGWC